jgi:hypothetical protein
MPGLQRPQPIALTDVDGDVLSASNPLYVSQRNAGLATYMATGLALTPAATPTDIITISGAANKLVRVLNLRAHIHTTSSTLVLGHFVKRSSANSGGTSSTATAIPLDSGDAAAAAVVRTYTANPTLGDEVGRIGSQYVTTLTPTAVPGIVQLLSVAGSTAMAPDGVSIQKPVTLRSAAESLCLNWNGAALAAGFIIAQWDILWTEADA